MKILNKVNGKKAFLRKLFFVSIFMYMIGTKSTDSHSGTLSDDYFKNWYTSNVTTIEEQMIKEVERYIKKWGPGSKISADTLVKICLEYDLNILLALAQAHVESHFGTKGVASRTNSVFNVGTFDNGVILYTYDHPDESVRPYAILLVNDYLKDKTEEDLLKNGGFVNYRGKRYASYVFYENKLRKVYDVLLETTDIDSLQTAYKNLNRYSELLSLNQAT